MHAIELATTRVVTMRPEDSLHHGAQLMQKHLVGCVVVARPDESGPIPVGVLTDRDLCRVGLAGGADMEKITVEAVMSRPLVTCPQEATLAEVIGIMRGSGLRRLPVVESQGRLVGIISANDVIAGAPRAPLAGLTVECHLGDHVRRGQPLFVLHAQTEGELAYALAYVARHPDIVELTDK